MKTHKAVLIALAAALPVVLAVCATAAAGRVLPTATATFTPGTFRVSYGEAGTPGWRQGPLVLDVTFAADQIADIEVVSHGETMHGSGWFFRAFPAVPDQILARQSTQDIDAFTGATVTRNAFVNAVNMAIVQAGASPADLEPRLSDAPLPGDLFVPGFHIVTVPAGAMDIDGNPLTADTPSDRVMLYSPDADMTLRVSVGRNEFHVFEGGARGLGQGGGGHGEPVVLSPVGIGGGTWGGWWFSQVAAQQINDFQATRNIDISIGATRSAAAVVWGVEQALAAAGGDPAALTPRLNVQRRRNPDAPNAPFFVPGHYAAVGRGVGGGIALTVTFDRSLIRRITVDAHSEPEDIWDAVWPNLRDAIYRTQCVDEAAAVFWHDLRERTRAGPPIFGAFQDGDFALPAAHPNRSMVDEHGRVHWASRTVSAILDAVEEAIAMADPGDL